MDSKDIARWALHTTAEQHRRKQAAKVSRCRSPQGRAGGRKSGGSTPGMVPSVPRALARTSGSRIKIIEKSMISAYATLRQLEGLKLTLSSKTCSPATQHAWERSSEGRFPAYSWVGVRTQPQVRPPQSGFEHSVARLRSTMK